MKKEAILDPWIIDKIKRDNGEKRRREEERPQPTVDVPLEDTERDNNNNKNIDKDRGIVIIDMAPKRKK